MLFTDGVDTQSRETYLQSLRTAQESNALIYSIQRDTLNDTRQKDTNLTPGTTVNIVTAKGEPLSVLTSAERLIELLSNSSGGRFYFADTVENLTKAFHKSLVNLTNSIC